MVREAVAKSANGDSCQAALYGCLPAEEKLRLAPGFLSARPSGRAQLAVAAEAAPEANPLRGSPFVVLGGTPQPVLFPQEDLAEELFAA
jgi:hypothetical protein